VPPRPGYREMTWHTSCAWELTASGQTPDAADGKGLMEACVVVVDDEIHVLELLRDVLEDDGMEVVTFSHPANVKAIGRRRNPDLMLLDLMLPGKSGIQLARELQSEGLAGTPMIAMSASSSMLRAASESELFEETLAKPFDVGELLDCVERHLHRI